MSHISLYTRLHILRFLQTVGRQCDNYLSTPIPRKPASKRKIKSTVGEYPGEFEILVYTPPGYEKLRKDERIPLLVNFHGGGYTIGHASDDARFITSLFTHSKKPFLAISVSYRLAPEHPFPIGISDCVSALLYLWSPAVAQELHIDISKTCVSGFSAGGQFCYTSLYMLYEHLLSLQNGTGSESESSSGSTSDESEKLKAEKGRKGKVVGICSFYAPADWTKSRQDRARSNPLTKPLSKIPELFFGLFEEAYFLSPPTTSSSFSSPRRKSRKHTLTMSSPLLSPGLATNELLQKALPQDICMINCEYDSLLTEGEVFRRRLKEMGKNVQGLVVKGVSHGWDKYPSWFWGLGDREGKLRRDEAYEFAAHSLWEFWDFGEGC